MTVIIYNRVAGVSQYGLTPVDVPLHLLDESLGSVRLYLREIPAGLRQELDERMSAEGDRVAVIREVIAWGVAGHDPEQFLEETKEGRVPIPYQTTEAEYHKNKWPVAHPETVALYEGALPNGVFLASIRAAISYYHAGIIPTPRLIWDTAPGKTPAPLP